MLREKHTASIFLDKKLLGETAKILVLPTVLAVPSVWALRTFSFSTPNSSLHEGIHVPVHVLLDKKPWLGSRRRCPRPYTPRSASDWLLWAGLVARGSVVTLKCVWSWVQLPNRMEHEPDVAYLSGRNTGDSIATSFIVRLACRMFSQFCQQSIQSVAVTAIVVLVCVNPIIIWDVTLIRNQPWWLRVKK